MTLKRFFRICGYTLGGLLFLVLAGAAYVYFKGIPVYEFTPPEAVISLQVPKDSSTVARGAKLATLLCTECHKGENGAMTGKFLSDVPKSLAPVYSLNITHDSVHGIGSWTDGELYYFLRTGIRNDGTWAPPMMPKYPLMADEDLKSIIAWLRSSDPALAANPQEFPPNDWNFLVKFLGNIAMFPPPFPEKTITIPDTTNQITFGRYVADALCSCYACHSADFTKQDMLNPEKSLGFYGGGNPLLNFEGELVPSANITMDKETGIGSWTKQQFLEATKYGKNPHGGPLYYPMFPHTTLTDTEVNAMWAYLQTVPPIQHKVQRFKPKK